MGVVNIWAKPSNCFMMFYVIKAVFIDFDYTIFSHKTKCIPKSTADALKTLKSNGIKLILATGRNTSEMELFPEYKSLGFDGYVMLNGQICLDSQMNTISTESFKGKSLESLVQLFNEKKQPVLFVEKDNMYINYFSPMIEKGMGEIICLDYKTGEYRGEPLYLAVVFISRKEELQLQKRLPECEFKRWGDFGVDIVCNGVDKVSGIRKFMEILNLKQDEIMAIGDSNNDCGMLEFAKIGVAMGNGTPSAKAAADFVTLDIDNDGLAFALRKYNLI